MRQRVLSWVRKHPVAPSGQRGLAVGALLLLLLAIGSGTALAVDRRYAVPEGAVARVGHVVITAQDLDEQTRLAAAITGQPAQPDKTLAAKGAVVNQVLEDVARQRGIVIADKTANDQLTELLEKDYPNGRDDFIAAMSKAGVPERVIVREIKRTMANSQLFEQVSGAVAPPTDQEVAQAYEEHKAEIQVPEQRHLRNIAVGSKEQADQVRARLDRGEDFAAVAKEVSLDTETKDNGGDLGMATKNSIPNQAMAEALFAAAPNSVFGPVQTNPQIWSIGQVLEVVPPSTPPLEQVRDTLRKQLFDMRKTDTFNRWLSEQLDDADVRYADAYRPADPTGMPSLAPGLAGKGTSK